MWWQGEDSCPEVVRLCWASIRKHCGTHKLNIITKDNYQDYITLPEHIIAKVKSGAITLTHLSDIIRVNLLAKYGGLWLDSTIFVADDIPEEVFSMEYYTIKNGFVRDWSASNISNSRWTVFCFAAGRSNSLLFCFMSDLLSEYCKAHNRFIAYFLTDYVLAIAIEEFPEFYQAWTKIPVNNTEWNKLCQIFKNNEEWSAEEYSKLTATTNFFKLTYKAEFDVKSSSGRETFYGHLLSEYNLHP